ncbi:hypothetical protein AB6F55_16320 [Providencia hangzhouensis]
MPYKLSNCIRRIFECLLVLKIILLSHAKKQSNRKENISFNYRFYLNM